ncbi:MAG: hypothetical protein HC917_14495 [Richelia sp. SM2_1_7]|nr:hypothetical protein [Richelia sp. SM2_1_7]
MQKIESGDRNFPTVNLGLEKHHHKMSYSKLRAIIAFICGCEKKMARDLMDNLPGTLNYPIYRHQGELLLRRLKKYGVDAVLV